MERLTKIMDEFDRIVNHNETENAVEKLIEAASYRSNTHEFGCADSIEALARLLVMCHCRRMRLEAGVVVEGFK